MTPQRAIIEQAEMASGGPMPGLFDIYLVDTGDQFFDLTVRQTQALIIERNLIPVAASNQDSKPQ